jgi:FMN phosphatase YigB (HAD superfamily)
MIKVLLLDLGWTLIDENTLEPFAGVKDALGVLKTLQTAEHKPLVTCLVSNFTMPEPRTDAAIAAAFKDYLTTLDQTGLREFFEPVDERVTLSTHAGKKKPAAVVFETALKRAKVDGPITDTLFITEQKEHVKTCRNDLQMTALLFGVDFTDWSAAPALIAQLIGAPG